jgi:hypothetical protein
MDHPDTYTAMDNLAATLLHLDQLSEAKGLEVQVLDWCKVYLEPEHPNTSLAIENLAYTLMKVGEFNEAGELFIQLKELHGATNASASPNTSTDSECVVSSLSGS